MRKIRRVLATMLIVITVITSVPINGLAAQEKYTINNEAENLVENVEVKEDSDVETIIIEKDSRLEEDVVATESEEKIGTVEEFENEENAEIVDEEEEVGSTDQELNKETYLFNYLMINQRNVEFGDRQNVVFGIDCENTIEMAVLTYTKQESGESFQQSYTEVIDGAILFEILFENISQSGTYQLDSVVIQISGITYTECFADSGIVAVFGMNKKIEIESDAVIADGTVEELETDMDIVRIDENGNTISETSLEEAIENVNAEQPALFGLRSSSEIVVVLDPGHDNTHAGAQANGLGEEDLNIKIAEYCKEELETYQGITVYLTRGLDGECPYPGTTSGKCNEKRVQFAQSVGANIYVSLHNNSATSTSAHGAMVFYPNKNYNSNASAEGKGLAQQIQDQLVALGLYDRGITIKDSADYKYPDESTADYYAVIRNSKLAGIPAIIVEHAFVSNIGDVNNFLNSNEKLKTLGVSDAKAIVSYYGLSKQVDVTVDSVKVSSLDNSKGSASIKALNVAPSDKISKVSFAAWSASDQNDLFWYDVINNGTGNYETKLDISNHKYNYGKYFVDAYAYDIYGNSHFIGGTTCIFTKPKQQFTVTGDDLQKSFRITATVSRSQSVNVAVWSQRGGQDDLIWYKAKENSSGAYVVDVPITNHTTAGLYYADVYVTKANGTRNFVGGTTFQVTEPSIEKIEIVNKNDVVGTFDVVLTGVQSISGVNKVQVPVWSKSDQSDLHWYLAQKRSDGSYIANVSLVNHKYNYGKYYVDTFVTAGNGVYQFTGGKTITMNVPRSQVQAAGNPTETHYTLTATDVWPRGSVKRLQFAVWSQKNGQDDLLWCTATKNSAGVYVADVPIKNHTTSGLYYADAYLTGIDGTKTFVGGATFQVTTPSIDKIEIVNKNDSTGTFDVVLTGVQSVSGVSIVQIPVWSKSDQSDLYWYIAEKQSDGKYIANVSLANHKYNYGKYYVDTFVTAGNGIYQYTGGTTITMSVPKSQVQAVGNQTETHYTITATDVWPQGSVKRLQFAVWSQKNGQDDLIWYTATKNSAGVYTVTVPIKNHKTAGLYYVHVYMTGVGSTSTYVGGTTFQITAPSVEKIEVVNKNDGAGTFDVVLTNVQPGSGVNKVQVPVWSKTDQSDLYWYIAKKQSNGSYIANVNISNHKYDYGKYYVDTFVTAKNEIYQYTGGTTITMNVPKSKIQAVGNTTETVYALTASDVGAPGGVKSVRFAVWSQKNGQDDLIWYTAENKGFGIWSTNAIISNHRTEGEYYVDAYARTASDKEIFIGGTTFSVEAPTVSSVTLVDYNEAFGVFGVDVEGVESVSGIESVKVAVWSSSDQSDLVWYNASSVSEGNYHVGVEIKNHGNHTGKYYADAYITTKNGIKIFAGGVSCSITNITNSIGRIPLCRVIEGSREEVTLRFNLELNNSVNTLEKYYVVETDLYDRNIEKVLISHEGSTETSVLDIVITGKENVNAALMDKFALAVKDANGNLILASESVSISNPEAVAPNTSPIFRGTSKKGLQGIAYASYEGGSDIADARNANTKQTLINLDLASVVSQSPKSGYVAYTYKGKTYYFSALNDLKSNIQSLNYGYKQYLYGNEGRTPVAVTLCLLLSYNAENSFLIDPAARTPGHSYYMLNVREENARETLEALFLYLGETFGKGYCYVSNWVLGNEINSSRAWNYSGGMDFDTYVDCYATAFRMLYNGVKAEKTGNTVCISLDNGWNATPDTYAGKAVLDTFAKDIHAKGPNIDWSIAYHAYSYPLTRADFWNDYGNTTDSLSTPYISMRNISVLTNYAGTLESIYGRKAGSIRVLLTEQGYSYTAGADNQAMAIVRGYYMAEFNDRIDAFIIRAIVDDPDETIGNLYFGLMNRRQEKRTAFYVYEFMDSDLNKFRNTSAAEVVVPENYGKFNRAKEIVCDTNWSALIPGFNASKLAGIK